MPLINERFVSNKVKVRERDVYHGEILGKILFLGARKSDMPIEEEVRRAAGVVNTTCSLQDVHLNELLAFSREKIKEYYL